MRKNAFKLALLLVFTMVLAACGASSSSGNNGSAAGGSTPNSTPAPTQNSTEPAEIVVKHQLGETTVKVNSEKIVVFDYGVLDTLTKLDIDVIALPKTNLPGYLSKYRDDKYINAGSLKEPDFETIHAAKPDLIIISGRQMEAYDELSEIAPTIYMGVDTTRYLESFEENTRMIGEIFNKEAEVEAELVTIKASIEALKDKATASGKNALIVLANEGNISAYGPASRFGIIHDEFGVAAIDTNIEVSTHGQSVTFEYILEQNPDYLFVIDRSSAVQGDSSAKSTIENALIKNTKAYKEGNIVYLNPEFWYLSGGGLISVDEMVKEVDAAIQ